MAEQYINKFIDKLFLTKIKEIINSWKQNHNINYTRLILFLKNNYSTLTVLIIYISFKQFWEELFDTFITVPVLSRFSVNIITTLIFVITSILLVYKTIQKRKLEKNVSDKTVAVSFSILILYIYYRCTTDTALHLVFPTFFCFVDIIPLFCIYSSINFFRKKQAHNTQMSNNGFLIDMPISKEENDLLNRYINAKEAVNKLVATNPKYEAFTFGIIAPWGEGKTSFMNLMKEYLMNEYKNGYIIMDFNPWIYSKKSELTHIFLDELSNKLSSYSTIFSKDLEKYADVISSVGNDGIKAITKTLTSKLQKTASEQFKELQNNIQSINKQIFVFIDDIDRLNCEEMEEIFRLVRITSSLPNMYFILAYDKKYVMDTLKKQFGNYSSKYTDKILQEEYEIPQADTEVLIKQLLLNLKNNLNKNEYKQIQDFLVKKRFYGINPMYFIKSIRTVKRIANQIIFGMRRLHGEVDVCDYFILELFRQFYKPVVDLLEKKIGEILMNKNGKYVYYNGNNVSEEDKKINISIGRTYFNIIEYITENNKEFQIDKNDISVIKNLLDALFGEYKSNNIKTINNPNYTSRYFRYHLLESEVSENEWDSLNKLTFEEMKPTIKEWMVNKSISLIGRIESEKLNDKQTIYKLLHLAFYTGSLLDKQESYNYDFIKTLLKGLYFLNGFTDEDRNEMEKCLTENKVNFYQMRYLFSLFKNGSYDESHILTKKEVIRIQSNTLQQFISEGHTMNDVLNCWRDTAYQEISTNSDGVQYIEYKHEKESRILMEEYAKKNFEDFVQAIIIYYTPNTNSEYAVSENAARIWDGWSNFYNYVIKLDNNSPIISEFKSFLSEFKKSEYKIYVPFKFQNIKLKESER